MISQLLKPRQSTKRLAPWWPNSFMMCHTIGRSPMPTSGLGTRSVSSRRRVPRPPARITTGIRSSGVSRLLMRARARRSASSSSPASTSSWRRGRRWKRGERNSLERELARRVRREDLVDALLHRPARLEQPRPTWRSRRGRSACRGRRRGRGSRVAPVAASTIRAMSRIWWLSSSRPMLNASLWIASCGASSAAMKARAMSSTWASGRHGVPSDCIRTSPVA